jgi:hypothetical protein
MDESGAEAFAEVTPRLQGGNALVRESEHAKYDIE